MSDIDMARNKIVGNDMAGIDMKYGLMSTTFRMVSDMVEKSQFFWYSFEKARVSL